MKSWVMRSTGLERQPWRLAFKLILSILTGTSLLIFIILLYNYNVSRRLLVESADETAEQLNRALEAQIENVLSTVRKAPESMALLLGHNTIRSENLEQMLKIALQNKPEIYGGCAAFEPLTFDTSLEKYAPYAYRSGNEILVKDLGDKNYNYNYLDQEWYREAMLAGQPIWTEPYFDKGGGNVLMTTYAVPFYSGDSLNPIFKGVVTADISLNWLTDLFNSIHIFNNGYAFLISDKGTIITHPNKALLMQNLFRLLDSLSDTRLKKDVYKIIHENQGYVPFISLVNQKPSLLFYSTLPQNDWHMAVVIPEEELFSGLKKLSVYTILMGIAGLLFLLLVVVLSASRVTRPLRRLMGTASEIGSGNFDIPIPVDRSSLEISLLGQALNKMQGELKEYIKYLEITTKDKERFESELNIAHDIQQGMIPKIFPPYPERKDIDVFALLKPARQVGGDLYDFFFLDDDTLCFAIGDVSDKGVPASLMMAITITLFRANSGIGLQSKEIVRLMNKDLSRGNANLMFITFFTGILNVRTGDLDFCNAGHNYPLLLRKDGRLEEIGETHGIPLGLDTGQEYGSGHLVLDKNDTLILYSDGITEAMDKTGELYGEGRFKQLIPEKCYRQDPETVAVSILADVSEFATAPEQSDDITLLVLSYYPVLKNQSAMKVKKLIVRNEAKELDQIRDFVEGLGKEWGHDPELVYKLNLILEEYVNNLISYGYSDHLPHIITIEISQPTNKMKVIVSDDGNPYDITAAPDNDEIDKPLEQRKAGGLGIHFIKTLANGMDYRSEKGLNYLTLMIDLA